MPRGEWLAAPSARNFVTSLLEEMKERIGCAWTVMHGAANKGPGWPRAGDQFDICASGQRTGRAQARAPAPRHVKRTRNETSVWSRLETQSATRRPPLSAAAAPLRESRLATAPHTAHSRSAHTYARARTAPTSISSRLLSSTGRMHHVRGGSLLQTFHGTHTHARRHSHSLNGLRHSTLCSLHRRLIVPQRSHVMPMNVFGVNDCTLRTFASTADAANGVSVQ